VVVEGVAFGLAGLAVVAAARWVAGRLSVPFTVLLTVVGAIYAFLPGPNVALEPTVVLTVVIPPLLYNAALNASVLDFRRFVRPIVGLSVGLVLATALAVGAVMSWAVAGIGFAAATALGAAVAPPDPVAALAIGRRVGLPPRLMAVIEGEGLLNDATALTTFQVATAAATGAGFSLASGIGEFVLSAVGGIAIGALIAFALGAIRPIRQDALLANAVSLGTPFACYIAGEQLHVSGVLAVVVAGLIAGHRLPRVETSAGRLQVAAVWRLINFLLEGLVFLLIGQQLPGVVGALTRYDASTVASAVAVAVGLVLFVRAAWLAAWRFLPGPLRLAATGGRPFSGSEVTVLTWAGMRGVITLAAAYSLPLELARRDLLLLCAFAVVTVTLLGQGLTFAALARHLGVRSSAADGIRRRNEARVAAVDAALARLDDMTDISEQARESLRRALAERQHRYQQRLDSLVASEDGDFQLSPGYYRAVAARREVIGAERNELLRWRDTGRLSEDDLRRLQQELDHQESLLPQLP
jgi:Na+/H+ antiporter